MSIFSHRYLDLDSIISKLMCSWPLLMHVKLIIQHRHQNSTIFKIESSQCNKQCTPVRLWLSGLFCAMTSALPSFVLLCFYRGEHELIIALSPALFTFSHIKRLLKSVITKILTSSSDWNVTVGHNSISMLSTQSFVVLFSMHRNYKTSLICCDYKTLILIQNHFDK